MHAAWISDPDRFEQAVAVVQRAIRGEQPAELMAGLGFGKLLLAATFPVNMSGALLDTIISGILLRTWQFVDLG